MEESSQDSHLPNLFKVWEKVRGEKYNFFVFYKIWEQGGQNGRQWGEDVGSGSGDTAHV